MHIPVLPEYVVSYLNVRPGDNAIDCTAGSGGHARAILETTAPNGKVLAIDWDGEAIRLLKTQASKSKYRDRLILREGNFADIGEIVEREKFQPVHAVLFDLGFSADQLESRGRGFSFQKSEPLDMRYSKANPATAEKIIHYQSRGDLERIFREYGEERFAKQIAGAIVEARSQKPIRTTADLVSIIEAATPKSYRRRKIHPATKTFQALRIAVNNELDNIEQGLEQAGRIVEPGGRIAVISFHSLEDRLVKKHFQQTPFLYPVNKKPQTASVAEIEKNPRARSAKLRVAQKQ